MGAVMVGYFMYYYESWILPAMMRSVRRTSRAGVA